MTRKRSEFLRCLFLTSAILFASGEAVAQSAEDSIGYIKTVAGETFVARDGERTPSRPGLPIYEKDVLETGDDGTLGATLKDNTLLSLGPNSHLALDSYLLEPDREAYSLITRLTRGTMQYVSGLIAELSPESVQIRTNVATLGLRGTRLLVRVDAQDE